MTAESMDEFNLRDILCGKLLQVSGESVIFAAI